jgi:hypothetical protein
MRLPVLLTAVSLIVTGINAPAIMAQDAVNAAYEAALAETPTPSVLREAQAGWLAQWTEYVDERADLEAFRLGELERSAVRDRAIRTTRLAAVDLNRVCVDTGKDGCTVENSGALILEDDTTLYYQVQAGSTEDEGMGSAMIVLKPDGEQLVPIFWLTGPMGVLALETYRADGEGTTYVALPAYGQGTGRHWMGSMFRWNGPDAAPTEIDVHSWLDALGSQLPEGLGVWKGPIFHWDWLSAESALWQDSDGNCCPSGGVVSVELKIEGDALAIANVAVDDAILNVAMGVEPEVLSWVSRREHCEHWQGEEPYDDDRRTQIAAAVQRLRCDALDTDEAALRAAYAENTSTLALLNRAKAE